MTRPFLSRFVGVGLAAAVFFSVPSFAATFIVPDDKELVGKSAAIVVGVVEDAVAKEVGDGHIDTIYTVRVGQALKGGFKAGTVIQVSSEGGNLGKRWMAVPGSAHFSKGDKVLLFLTRHRGTWTLTDMTLGKFKFVTSTGGQSLLLRDQEDVVGFDKEMRTHVERIRREDEFLKFVEDTARGREAEVNYFLSPQEAVSLRATDKAIFDVSPNSFTPQSYAIHFTPTLPGRWADVVNGNGTPIRMSATVAAPFFKSTQQNASGLGDGGVAMLQTALAGWNNDCGSIVNAPYGGTNGLLNAEDAVNTVVWNDPNDSIPAGGGVVAKAFLAGEDLHTFAGLTNGWVNIFDCDVVVQNGFTGAEVFMGDAMTHEIGHCIGLRHANTHHDGTACQGTDECTSSAIMNSSVSGAFNSVPQAWDINGIRALYPTSCVSAPSAPTGVTATATSSSAVTVSWAASAGATSYKVYRRTSITGLYTEIATGVVGTTFNNNSGLTANTGYQYMVRATNGGGDSGDSNTDFTVTTSFTDTMAAGLGVKAIHFTELRTAINALRALGNLGAFSFSGTTPASGVAIIKNHVDDMRTALNVGRTSAGGSALTFGETIQVGVTPPKASHITELRDGVL